MMTKAIVMIILATVAATGYVLVGRHTTSFAVASGESRAVADPVVDEPLASAPGERSVVVAGGCFWGIQAVFQRVNGVKSAVSGYSGGEAATAHYEQVSDGDTGHAESVKITYDPSQVSLGKLLKVFFSVAHDPTELNRQGPDVGTQYRSAIFTANDEQQKIVDAYIKQLNDAHVFSGPIVTKVGPLAAFYAAEDYHQDYADRHPESPYIRMHDLPKVANLQKTFPELYRAK